MQNLQDIQEKIFFEAKNILDTLSKIDSKDELLTKQDLFAELTDRISFLRILEKNKESFLEDQSAEYQTKPEYFDASEHHFEDSTFDEDMIEEEVLFTTEINAIQTEQNKAEDAEEFSDTGNSPEIYAEENAPSPENIEFGDEDNFTEIDVPKEEINGEEDNVDPDQRLSQKEQDFLESEERRRKIVEINKHEVSHPTAAEVMQEQKAIQQQQAEKKFRLSSIKGLKAVQNLFDEDPLEKLKDETSVNKEPKSDSGSLLKTNIPTDFMEAPKKQHEFKLDFNDKVAFTKLLFHGNEDELKSTIDRLNSFDNVEEARKYLSDVYYQKDWSKVDEYAQRLWDLVENKFL